MEIYVELVLIDNFFMDLIILFFTAKVLNEKFSIIKMISASLLGSIFALAIPILGEFMADFPIVFISLKFVFGCFLVVISRGTFKGIFVATITFYICTFVVGGAMIGLSYIFKSGQVFQTFFLLDVPTSIILIVPIVMYFLIKMLVIKFFSTSSVQKFLYKGQLIFNNKSVNIKIFHDSGNFLVDLDNNPLPIVQYSSIKSILTVDELLKLPKLPISSTSNLNAKVFYLKGFELVIDYGKKSKRYTDVSLGIVLEKLQGGHFDLLVGSKFLLKEIL